MEFLLCLLAAIMQELLHWIDVRQEMHQNVKIVGSTTYWLISISFVGIFSLLSFIVTNSIGTGDLWFFILIALVVPEFFRKVIKIILGWVYPIREVLVQQEKTQFRPADYFKKS